MNDRQHALEVLRDAVQNAEQFGLVRTGSGSVITGAVDSKDGFVLTGEYYCQCDHCGNSYEVSADGVICKECCKGTMHPQDVEPWDEDDSDGSFDNAM